MKPSARMRLGRAAIWTAIVLAVGVGAPGLAQAHDAVTTPDQHAQQDRIVARDAATEQRLTHETVARTRSDAQAAAAAVSSDPGQSGQWGPVEDWPVVGIHVALLPNGKVLAWDAVGDMSYTKYTDHTFTRATVYDPATHSQTPAWVQGFDIFCAGLAHLTNGILFAAGGNADQFSNGIVQTHTFDYTSNTWTRGADMRWPRWYPTVTPLTNGEMLIIGGRPWIPEVRQTDGAIRALSEQTGSMDVPFYPWMDVAPDGRVFYSGPDDVMRKLDPSGAGAWQGFGPRGDGINRDYGSHALYNVGKLLVAGGGPSTSDARTIDFNGATPQVTRTSPMSVGRRQFNLTVLADGSVLATGGNSTGVHYIDMNGGVYNAERWDPATGTWTTLAAEQVTRQYHSSALLLPDGRVLSSGGGICDDCDAVGYLAKNAQIFTPPYLFKKDGSGQLAPRPVISSAPSAVPYDADFQITTPNAASIRKVALLRIGANTHAVNFEQRYVPLSFTVGTDGLTTKVPANANITPPGFYMLIVVDAAGVPSVAKMVRVGSDAPPPPPPPTNQPPAVTLTQPPNSATFTAPATVSLAATASDADGTVAKVEFYNGSTKLGEDPTAPYTFTWSGVGAGTYTLTAKATDNAGASTTSAPSTITVSAPPGQNQPPTASITSPADGAVFSFKPTITISANASDPDGTVTKVDFLDGTTVLGSDTTAPYSYTWKNVPTGSHTLRARATDNTGATGTSAPVTITVRKR